MSYSLGDLWLSHHPPNMSGAGCASSSIEVDPMTLSRFILTGQERHPDAKGDLTIIMMAIQTACKVIASAVRKAGIAGLYGLEGAVNVQGEDQKKLDVVANDNFVNLLRHTGKTSVLVSEEVSCAGFAPNSAPGFRGFPLAFTGLPPALNIVPCVFDDVLACDRAGRVSGMCRIRKQSW
jgi:hypothetical protein